MKSAGNKSGLPVSSTSSPLSHIPLPKRKNSSKGEKSADVEDTDSELSGEYGRSQPKMSLLGSTSFCCASGQKEDCGQEFVPAFRPPKKTHKKSPTSSPLLSQGRIFFARNKRDKNEAVHPVVEDVINSSPRDSKGKLGSHSSDSRLRQLNDKRKIAPPSPQKRSNAKVQPKFAENGPKLTRENSKVDSVRMKRNPAQTVHFESTADPTSLHHKSPIGGNGIESVENDANPSLKAAASNGCVDFCRDQSQNQTGAAEDLDCPCCDSVTMNDEMPEGMDIKVIASCDVVETRHQLSGLLQDSNNTSDSYPDKERTLLLEVESLKEDLEGEKQKLRSQQSRVQHLEEELVAMQQLKDELEKEKELKKIAEDKLLELLDHERRIDSAKRDNEKRMESKGIQLNANELNQGSSLQCLSGYEGCLRKYQTYIAKLEKDNLMLLNELKKFKDMSPRSQEEQARLLLDKLGQMERNNHQQQIQYESCLDEVANKLVQTLLVQKRLEEECKVLHLRVEQLEHENKSLLESIDTNNKVDKKKELDGCDQVNILSPISDHGIPSQQPLTSSPKEKKVSLPKIFPSNEEKMKKPSKVARFAKSPPNESKSPISSPVSPGLKSCSSKIPSFSTTKPFMHRQKSDLEHPKSKTESRSRDSKSYAKIPPSKSYSQSSKSKLPGSQTAKGICVKRKRLSRNASPADKDSKQRIKVNRDCWDQPTIAAENLIPFCMDSNISLSPIQGIPPQQQVWSFNCEIPDAPKLPEVTSKVNHSIDILSRQIESLDFAEDFNAAGQKLSTPDNSATTEGVNRTRDEGYSTMSSDLQQDSAADTTISEPEHSSTFVISEKNFNSDDSVTECMDSSMCSSSDSGFGPLNQISNSTEASSIPLEQDSNNVFEKLPKLDSSRISGTVRSKEQIASVKPTVRTVPTNVSNPEETDTNPIHANVMNSKCQRPESILIPKSLKVENSTSTMKINDSSKNCDNSASPNFEQLKRNLIDCIDYPKEVLSKSYRNSWHLGSSNSLIDEKILFCTRHSYIDDNLFDEKVQTAEKSTLTEPEEELWREKALAPFIDESIWSLYSSESDIQVKHFPLEPLLSELSLEKLIASCSPCIVVSEDIDMNPTTETQHTTVNKPPSNSSAIDLNLSLNSSSCRFKPGLERVASDTVLYLKDAIHELEDSMRRGLKSSKNISALHQNSDYDTETSPNDGLHLKPELLTTLEATLLKTNNLSWPSPSHTSSTSSLQSSGSCHVISDEAEDVDGIRSSRKGSQDPDLSSDAEYENLDHKEFVERWLQKETTGNIFSKQMVSQLESVEEIGEFTLSSAEKKPLSRSNSNSFHHRARLKSPEFIKNKISSENSDSEFVNNAFIDMEENDAKLDPEATEFNGDFYTLCSIGSLKSLDRFSPARTIEQKQMLVDSPVLIKKSPPISFNNKNDKSKPTGLVKPTRPVSLPVPATPVVPEHTKKAENRLPPRCLEKNASRIPRSSEENYQNAKLKTVFKVPASTNYSIVRNYNSETTRQTDISPSETTSTLSKSQQPLPTGLPIKTTTTTSSQSSTGVKSKSPTKILQKNNQSPKNDDLLRRQQWRRDKLRQNRLKEGCGTAWIHLQPNSELSDPTVRISLLDSIKAPTSSSGSSSEEEEEEDILVIQTTSHLHRICRERRNRVKASANNPLYDVKKRSSIMGRRELFYRFGDKEREAIACFDFLEDIPSSSLETLAKRAETSNSKEILQQPVPSNTPPTELSLSNHDSFFSKERISFLSPTFGDASKMTANCDPSTKMADFAKSPLSAYSARRLRLPNLWNKPLSHNMSSSTLNSQDCELLDHISLSDSCAESYSSSTPDSYDDIS